MASNLVQITRRGFGETTRKDLWWLPSVATFPVTELPSNMWIKPRLKMPPPEGAEFPSTRSPSVTIVPFVGQPGCGEVEVL